MRSQRISFVLILSLLVGCAQLGVTPITRAPKTIEESLLIAAKSGEGFTDTFVQLRQNALVTDLVYVEALGHLQTAFDTVKTGLTLYAAGNYSGAMTNLDKADLALHALAGILAQVNAAQLNKEIDK